MIVSDPVGARLKAERERQGIALADVAETTKIPASLLEALERGDLSRWPKGLYRRAFFRSYVEALGLPAEPLTSEFMQAFPDDEPTARVVARATPAPAAAPRRLKVDLTRMRARMPKVAPLAGRVRQAVGKVTQAGSAAGHRVLAAQRSFVMALAELALVAAAGSLLAWWMGMTLLEATGVAALVFYPLSRALAGRTLPLERARALGQGTWRVVHQAAATTNYLFWRAIRTGAGQLQGLATRRLSRISE